MDGPRLPNPSASPPPAPAAAPGTAPGTRFPVGATWSAQGTNFSVFSRVATDVELLLYRDGEEDQPYAVIALDRRRNHSFSFWHVYVPDVPKGTYYNWRVARPSGGAEPDRWEVLDPWARAVDAGHWSRSAASQPGHPLGLRGIVVDPADDWSADRAPARNLVGAVIYEMHVGHFTRHPSAGVGQPGTYAALKEKIPYLRDLGITHVQLLPVAAFDPQDVPAGVAAKGLSNAWGYSPYGFCAPHPGYASGTPADAPREFRDLVKALHAAGIGVILDVVFNHTAEGGATGPVINYKGVAPDFFYHRSGDAWRDYTGCGNTVNCNHPLVTRLLVSCLERWVEEMHVDGFRFDLASVFSRGEDGAPMPNPPLPWAIEFSRPLGGVPLIAEAWDAAGLYQVGGFPGLSWSEWNGRYRDVMRRFVRGDPGLAGEVATCLSGSSDLYQSNGRQTTASINFITCHDGFTLMDLVSYNGKHNEANGESNRDGSDNNMSWNCGAEGATDDARVIALRRQQARNFVALLMLSQGVPMLLSGDEVLRTQQGNNNAWCQDNEVAWFDWRLTEANADMLRFVKELIALRRRHPSLQRTQFLTGQVELARGLPDIAWHGREVGRPPWVDRDCPVLACTLAGTTPDEEDLHILLNMTDKAERMALPAIPGRRWFRAIDTDRDSPADIHPKEKQGALRAASYLVRPRSVVVLESR